MNRKRQGYISLLNVLACFSVVFMHCNGSFWNKTSDMNWIVANFIETTCYFAVPVFFMLTGVTLLDYTERYSTKVYFIKRIQKVFLPFVIWSMVSLVYQYYVSLRHGEQLDLDFLHTADNILNARYMSVYWFFIPLFSIYLSIPILAKIKDKEETFLYASILGILFTSTLPLAMQLLGLSMNTTWIPGPVSGQLFLPMLGYVLSKKELQLKHRVTIYAAGIVGWGVHFFGTALLSEGAEINMTFKGDSNLPAVLWACAVFVFIKYHAKSESKIINWIAKRTFGIYLIHMYLILFCTKILHINLDIVVWKIAGTLIIFFGGAVIIWLMQKIPLVRKLVP